MGQAQNIEKQIQLLSTLHIGFMAAGIFFLILAVVLFIYLKIPEVFNEYRGKSAKKEMEQMAANSSESGGLVTHSSRNFKAKKNDPSKRYYTEELHQEFESTPVQLASGQQPFAETKPQEAAFQSQAEEGTELLDQQKCWARSQQNFWEEVQQKYSMKNRLRYWEAQKPKYWIRM